MTWAFPKTEVKASSSPPGGGRHTGHKSHPLWSSDGTNWKTHFVYIVTSQHCSREAGEEESQPIKCSIVYITVLFYRVIVQLFKVEYSVLEQCARILLSQNEQFPSCSCIKIWDNQCVGRRTPDSPLPESYFILTSSWDMVNRVLYPRHENNRIMVAHIVLARRWKCWLMFSRSVVFRQINPMMKCAFI